jgi:hypothetical protein
MRRIVRDYIASALDRQRGERERFIAEHILHPDAFPLVLAGPVVAVSEIAHLQDRTPVSGRFSRNRGHGAAARGRHR